MYNPAPIAGLHLVAHTGLHGIGLPDGRVACEIAMAPKGQPWDVQSGRIETKSLQDFSAGYLPQIFPWDMEYNREAVIQRALSTLGMDRPPNIARTGDNFASWCVTGFELQPDTPIFGQQLAAKRQVLRGVVRYQHHGVGIDGGYVVHFNKLSGKQVVHVAPFAEFSESSDVVIMEHEKRYFPLWARNRAINMIGWRQYDLADNNCEHVASFCVTGDFKSKQVNAVKTGVAVTAAIAAVGAALAYFISREDDEKENE